MKPALKKDLRLLSEILEDLVNGLPELKEADLIDVAARLKPIHKNADKVLDHAKLHIKTKLKGKEGLVLGEEFKGKLKHVPTTRLNQKALKEGHPKIHAIYNEDVVDDRITYELR